MRGSKPAAAGWRWLVTLLLSGASACQPQSSVAGHAQALQGPQAEIAGLCGFICDDRGVADGNAVISGVNAPDKFFASVVAYVRGVDALATAIDKELAATKADFGVSGDLGPEIAAQTEMLVKGALSARAGRPSCWVEARSLLDAQARCDANLDRASAVMRCAGSCMVARDTASCPDNATLRCAQPSTDACDELCRGECTEPSADAQCDGDCLGTCSGACAALDKDGRCAGACDGTCDGQCRKPLFDAARCDGDCRGECVIDDPRGGCDDALSVQCTVPDTGETVACAGSCDGQPIAAVGDPACVISAQIDAILNLSCRAGGVSLTAIPLAAPEDPALQARYMTALGDLARSLPHLLVLAEQGERLLLAGEDLKQAVRGQELPQSLIDHNMGDIHTRFAVGLECASDQLVSVETILDTAGDGLAEMVDTVGKLRGALGLVSP